MVLHISALSRIALVSLLLPLIAGCVTINPKPQVVEGRVPVSDGFLTVVVGPGQGGSCVGTPCSIYYRIPELGGQVEVVANGFVVGSFPSGEVVSLGNYNETSVRIDVPGHDVPTAFVRIPRDGR